MNNEELARVNMLDRYQEDLADFAAHLLRIQDNINMAETYRDPEFFIAARKEIQLLLGEIQQSHHLIGVKRNLIKQAVIQNVTADVDRLFDDPLTTRFGALPKDLRPQDGD